MKTERVLAVIPARLSAQRFPGKPLQLIAGKPMIEWVWRAAVAAKSVDRTVIATEDEAIVDAAKKFGAEAVLTKTFASGSDRVAAVAQQSRASIILNVQGDEPLLRADAVDELVASLDRFPWAGVSTLVRRVSSAAAYEDPNVVKAVVNADGRALYFSRSPIGGDENGQFWQHLGLYGYRREALLAFCQWTPAPWEKAERLEQLRLLWHGVAMCAQETTLRNHSVDVPGDISVVEQRMNEASL